MKIYLPVYWSVFPFYCSYQLLVTYRCAVLDTSMEQQASSLPKAGLSHGSEMGGRPERKRRWGDERQLHVLYIHMYCNHRLELCKLSPLHTGQGKLILAAPLLPVLGQATLIYFFYRQTRQYTTSVQNIIFHNTCRNIFII